MEKFVEFKYGPLTKPLELQANIQGYTLGSEADNLERLKHSLNICCLHLSTESQSKSMHLKLHKKVMKALEVIKDKPKFGCTFDE